jgi:transmembrane sensor
MSGHSTSTPQGIDAMAVEWIRRKEFGDWTDATEHEFEAWLAQSVLHRVAYLRLDECWVRTERLAALRPPERHHAVPPRPGRSWTIFLRVAAAALVIGALGVVGQTYLSRPSEETYTTPIGGREILTLFDGSHVELNTDTVLRVVKDRREAILIQGEAYFQIRHDANNPFVVTAASHRITDLGTNFSVRDSTDKLEVVLLEGKARIENTDSSRTRRVAVLTPGDIAVATVDTLSVTKMPVQTLTNNIGWRRGVVIFRHMALADAAAEFNRYNLKKLIVEPSVANVTIDGTFATDNLETFARIARIALGLHVESREHEIVVSR